MVSCGKIPKRVCLPVMVTLELMVTGKSGRGAIKYLRVQTDTARGRGERQHVILLLWQVGMGHEIQRQPADLMVPVLPGKYGRVYSPFAKEKEIDVSDFPPGTLVRCPYTQKIFRVP